MNLPPPEDKGGFIFALGFLSAVVLGQVVGALVEWFDATLDEQPNEPEKKQGREENK